MTAEGERRAVRFGIVGFGRIGRRLAQRLPGTPHAPDLVAVLVREGDEGAATALVGEGRVCMDLRAFAALRLDVAVECASPQALAAVGPALIAAGIDLMPLSLVAFADPATEERLMEAAAAGPGRIEIPPGAMGSLGFLAAAREDALARVVFRAAYPPQRWAGTPVALPDPDALREPAVVFRGSVREVARLFPRHLNVSVGVALAGLGLDRTEAELVADPQITQARFEVEAEAGPGAVSFRVSGRDAPIGADPVDYTAFSLMRLLRRRQAPVAV
jgi:aspartate dehydrogenase